MIKKLALVFWIAFFIYGQYWLFSIYWIGGDDVRHSNKRLVFVEGKIEQIECLFYKRKRDNRLYILRIKLKDGFMHSVAEPNDKIWLKDGYILEVEADGTFVNCGRFYRQFEDIFYPQRVYDGDEEPAMLTKLGEARYYEPIIFEGYFAGSNPIKASFNGHVWWLYEDMKSWRQIFTLTLSFTFTLIFVLILQHTKWGTRLVKAITSQVSRI